MFFRHPELLKVFFFLWDDYLTESLELKNVMNLYFFYWLKMTDAQISITTMATWTEGGLPVIGQVRLKRYLHKKKIYMSLMTRHDFLQPLSNRPIFYRQIIINSHLNKRIPIIVWWVRAKSHEPHKKSFHLKSWKEIGFVKYLPYWYTMPTTGD